MTKVEITNDEDNDCIFFATGLPLPANQHVILVREEAEENDLMQFLRSEIDQEEEKRNNGRKIQATTADVDRSKKCWELRPLSQAASKLASWGRNHRQQQLHSSNLGEKSRVKCLNNARYRKRYTLPRWIPNEYGGYDCLENNTREFSNIELYNRQQFVDEVIVRTEHKIKSLGKENQGLNGLKNISFWASGEGDHKQHSHYVLQAEGTTDALVILETEAQRFVRNQIERINLQRLVNDNESLLVDINWPIPLDEQSSKKKRLGANVSPVRNPNGGGVYVKAIHPKSFLAKALKNPAVYAGVCAIIAINGTEINDVNTLERMIAQVRKPVEARKVPTMNVPLTLCLWKYVDWKLIRQLKLKVRKNDGTNFDYIPTQEQQEDKSNEKSDDATITDSSSASILEIIPRRPKTQVMRSTNGSIHDLWDFEKKMRPLLSLDYKDAKIHMKVIASAMWKKHKELFGDDKVCGKQCRCILVLPQLVDNVIEQHIKRQNDKNVPVGTKEEIEKQTRGICKFFVPRFSQLLVEEYPEEDDERLIKRLATMWGLHQKNRMYGVNCKETCGCEEEWDQNFGKGNMARAKAFVASKRKRLPIPKKAPQKRLGTDEATIPRKKRSLASISSNGTNDRGNENKKKKLSGFTDLIRPRTTLFEVGFETSVPLGAYFRSKGDNCFVYSKTPGGQMAKDPRIGFGTGVVSVIIGETRKPISSHAGLQHFYETAQRTRKKLCILFNDRKSNRSENETENCWDDSGHWVGSAYLDENDGWAGGAAIAQVRRVRPGNVSETLPITSELPGATPASIPQWTSVVSTSEPGHKLRSPKKNLLVRKSTFLPEPKTSISKVGVGKVLTSGMERRVKRERTHSKTVKFLVEKNEEIYFYRNEAVTIRKIPSFAGPETEQAAISSPSILEFSQDVHMVSTAESGTTRDFSTSEFRTVRQNPASELRAVQGNPTSKFRTVKDSSRVESERTKGSSMVEFEATQACTLLPPIAEPYSERSQKSHIELPSLISRNWVVLTSQKKCFHKETCRFFKQHRCRFWHEILNPLPVSARDGLPPDSSLPTLESGTKTFKMIRIGSIQWFTGAYLDPNQNLIIYAQKIPGDNGEISNDGVVWYRSAEEVVKSIRITTHLFRASSSRTIDRSINDQD